jgi:branched-chain amino acid transport system ATP-binding protein
VILELEGVSRTFGGLRAVADVSLSVAEGERQAIIGPNGAGKSTLFKLITGALPVSAGAVRFAGADVTSAQAHRRARMGIAQTFQHSSLFPLLTCRDNVVLALQRVAGDGATLHRRHVRATEQRAEELLESAGLGGRAAVPSGWLSHGERRQLEVVMALACSPRLLLLDEPAAGMSAAETAQLAETIEALPADLTVVLIEHDLDLVFRVARRVAVLHLGALIADGTCNEVRAAPEVDEAYLGGAASGELFLDSPPAGGVA